MSAPVTNLGIVVGVDGSAASNVAVYWAARDASMRNVPLTLAHVVNGLVSTWPRIPLPVDSEQWQEEQGQQFIDDALKIVQHRGRRSGSNQQQGIFLGHRAHCR